MKNRIECSNLRIAIIGAGAAGFFTAITAAETNPAADISLYERSSKTLSKVKISGGGRCNVTHHCFDPDKLAAHYPRGARELRAAFYRWQPQDTIDWFAQHKVVLKTENDGRMFPDTDSSQTIIDCFNQAVKTAGIRLQKNVGLKSLSKKPNHPFSLTLTDNSTAEADAVCIATGSLKASPLSHTLKALGHTIEPLAPSLFAFNLADKRTHGLSGLSVHDVTVRVLPDGLSQTGPLLITHCGLSGPAILRLSAWEARRLQQQNYHFDIEINWLGNRKLDQIKEHFFQLRKHHGRIMVKNKVFEAIPRRLWERIVNIAGISETTQWSQLSRQQEMQLIQELIAARFSIQGKTTNKDEFVTCGGICLKEVDFRTMESRKVPGLYFAGECLDVDGITGGFNFQAAWTTGHIAGKSMAIETKDVNSHRTE